MSYIEISALNGYNVEQVRDLMILLMLIRRYKIGQQIITS